MGTTEYQGIRFSYADMLLDIVRMRQLARRFLDSGSDDVLNRCYTELENARNATWSQEQEWAVPRATPVRTRLSKGEYRDSDRGAGRDVYGELTFTWKLRNPKKGARPQRWFHLIGRASTSLKVFAADARTIVAQWQFEAGDADSPGCHFHSAVNQYASEGAFPEWLKVPRFPGLLLTPMDALEFLLGELFQRAWHREVSEKSEARDAWAKAQRGRLERLLHWQLERVANGTATPWMSLKKAKPHLEIFDPK